ncbi:integrase arm-type DNA-binding domain-containing protein [Altererythrobacter palmitatis]|uniref:Integrase arm-type DNA-binding domain-containing protein n=1 Tax=Alteraurantiacibacter palmitatis TaxID=2054628 RepID=A0ABV7E1R2_9SPHN
MTGNSRGLYLLVTPAGGRLWRLKFGVDGKERKLALGRYPEICPPNARKKRDAARAQIAHGDDPARATQRRNVQAKPSAENAFAAIAAEYAAKRKRDGAKGWAPSIAIRGEYLLSLLNESGTWHPDAIERALAHGDTDKVRRAYHRGPHRDERVRMAQWWSDYLDALQRGADVVPFPNKATR